MKVHALLADLRRTHAQWRREARSLDIEGQTSAFAKGVAFGLNIAVKIVDRHREKRRKR